MPVRRVRRIIRKIDPWTVLKVSLIFNSLLALAGVLGSVVFWSIFVNAGIPDRISEIAEQLTLTFNADGPTYFRVIVLLAVMWTVLATGFFTLGALLYNLIADIVGGVEVVVLEETLVAPPMPVTSAGRKVRPAQRSAVTMEPVPTATGSARPAAKKSRLPKINLPKRTKTPAEPPPVKVPVAAKPVPAPASPAPAVASPAKPVSAPASATPAPANAAPAAAKPAPPPAPSAPAKPASNADKSSVDAPAASGQKPPDPQQARVPMPAAEPATTAKERTAG